MLKKIEQLFIKNFWLAAFLVLAFFLYENESSKIKEELRIFSLQLKTIEDDITYQAKKKKLLESKIKSLNDPSTIELALINKLGMVPEGYIKLIINETAE